MKKKLLLLLLLVSLSVAKAQSPDGFLVVSSIPTSLLSSTFRIDVEKSLSKTSSIVIGPEIFNRKVRRDGENNSEKFDYSGYGVNFIFKKYLSDPYKPSIYIAANLTLRNIDIRYSEDEWVSYTDNGINLFRIENIDKKDELIQGAVGYVVGYLIPFTNNLVIDGYLGTGYKTVFTHNLSKYENSFATHMLKPGYSGAIIFGGIKIGGIFYSRKEEKN